MGGRASPVGAREGCPDASWWLGPEAAPCPIFPMGEEERARLTVRRVQSHETGLQMAACKPARALTRSQKNPPWSSKNRAPDSPANLAAAVTDFGARTVAKYCVCTALVAAAANLHRRCR